MNQVSAKLRRATDGYSHWCPACGEMHPLPDSWSFNGDLNRPTFAPSFKHSGKQSVVDQQGQWTGEWVRGPDDKPLDWICHYFLTDGVLDYQPDCTHAMAGQKVPLPDLPDFMRDDWVPPLD